MWQDYGTSYSDALKDEAFVAWREIGARQKALNIVRVCSGIKVQSAIEIGCGTGAVLRFLHTMNFAQQYACVDVALPAVQFVQKTCGDFVQLAFVGLADALPFQDAVFDVAILTHVVEHLHDPVPAIRGIDVFPIDSSLKSRYGCQKLVYCIGILIVQAMDTSHTLIERLLHSRRLILECFQLAF